MNLVRMFVLRCEAAKNFLVKQRRTTENYKVKSYHKQNYDES